MSSNYADTYITYLEAGWPSVLPLPKDTKWPPPEGFTGRQRPNPNLQHYTQWAQTETGNICLRMPDNIIGIDIDAYGDKQGAQTLEMLELELGYLPPTWRTTSRDDGTSGIRFFRIPPNLKWPSELGPGIEVVRREHRYAVVWPSTHPNGNTYRWINPHDTATINHVPTPEQLPQLPAEWVKHFTNNRQDTTTTHTNLNKEELTHIITSVNTEGKPCAQVAELDQQFCDMIAGNNGSRHDHTLTYTLKLISLGARGHKGIKQCIETWQHMFINIIGADRGRDTATTEWNNLLRGAYERNPDINAEPCLEHNCTPNNYHLDLPPGMKPTPDIDETTTWEPIDLYPIYTGDREPEQPTILTREDNKHLLYPGKVHSIYGEPESGKSLIIQYTAAQLIQNNERVLYIDCESDEYTLIDRLKRFGCSSNQLEYFTYIRPERSWKSTRAEYEAWQQITSQTYTLAVIDGVTEALTLFGYETNDNDGITKFMRLIPRHIARQTGAATIIIDHIAKNTTKNRFAIGGQAKLAAIDGAAYLLDIIDPIAIGTTGTLKMHITKDRPGQIRAHCWKDPDAPHRMQLAAVITINSETTNLTTVTIDEPTREDGTGRLQAANQVVNEAIVAMLNDTTPQTKKNIEETLRQAYGRNRVRQTIDWLIREGYIKNETSGKNGKDKGLYIGRSAHELFPKE